MLISALTALLNLAIALRIVMFTNNSSQHRKYGFYTAIAVVIVAISLESAITIIFVGEHIDHGEFLGTLIVAGIVFAVRGDIAKLFSLLSQARKNKD